MRHLKSFNESKRSTALDRGEGYISKEKSREIYDIVDDCLVYLKDDGHNITRSLQDLEEIDTEQELLGLELFVRLYRLDHFSLDDVKEYLNDLISHLDSIYIDLKSIKYRVDSEHASRTFEGAWFDLSMDPVAGEIVGNKIIGMKDNGGRDVSDIKSLISIELRFI